MVDLAEIQTAYYLVAATGVLVAAIYYINNLRATRKAQELAQKTQEQNLDTRQAQLFMNVYQTSYSKEYNEARSKIINSVKDYDEFVRFQKDPQWVIAFSSIAGFLEGIGVLVREDLVNIRLVSLLMSGECIGFWALWGKYILQFRKDYGFPRYCIEIEYLAGRVSDYAREHPELRIEVNRPNPM